MNSVRIKGAELAGDGPLIEFIKVALDLSESREEEVEVLFGGVRVAGFTGGKRTFPPSKAEVRAETIEMAKERMIDDALKRARGNISEAARLVGIGKTTLYRHLARAQRC